MYEIKGGIENFAGTTSFVGTPSVTVLGEDDANFDCSVTANDTDDRLDINILGADGIVVRWTANVRAQIVQWLPS